MRQIRQVEHRRRALVIDGVELKPELLDLRRALTARLLNLRGVLALALRARDFVARGVLLAFQSFELGNQPAPCRLEHRDLFERFVRIETTIAQSGTDFFDVIPDV